MNREIECAYCDSQAQLLQASKELVFRKEAFKVIEYYYKCNKCQEEFTTTETDTVTLLQAHNQYREKYHIPFQEDIVALREKYGLSASKMSEILGLGVNGYSNYEKGEVPSIAIGNLISTIQDPEVFLKMIHKSTHLFSELVYSRIVERFENLITEKQTIDSFNCRFNQYIEPSSLTGYRRPNKDKIANLLVAFLRKCNEDFNDRVKLNKLLFYTDFANYKKTGFSITGLSYRAINYGPVPTWYDKLFYLFIEEDVLKSNWIKISNGSAKEVFITDINFDNTLFTNNELAVIDDIIETYKNTPSWDLVDLSHDEDCWKESNLGREIINYQDAAFSLKHA